MTSLLTPLSICWGVITLGFIGLFIYRSLVAMKEEDLLFLDPAECHLESEQHAILIRLSRITPVVKGFAVASAVLLLIILGIWVSGRAVQ